MTAGAPPVLCRECESTFPATIVAAGVIRDDSKPARCPLCGFRIDGDGARLPENEKSPLG